MPGGGRVSGAAGALGMRPRNLGEFEDARGERGAAAPKDYLGGRGAGDKGAGGRRGKENGDARAALRVSNGLLRRRGSDAADVGDSPSPKRRIKGKASPEERDDSPLAGAAHRHVAPRRSTYGAAPPQGHAPVMEAGYDPRYEALRRKYELLKEVVLTDAEAGVRVLERATRETESRGAVLVSALREEVERLESELEARDRGEHGHAREGTVDMATAVRLETELETTRERLMATERHALASERERQTVMGRLRSAEEALGRLRAEGEEREKQAREEGAAEALRGHVCKDKSAGHAKRILSFLTGMQLEEYGEGRAVIDAGRGYRFEIKACAEDSPDGEEIEYVPLSLGQLGHSLPDYLCESISFRTAMTPAFMTKVLQACHAPAK